MNGSARPLLRTLIRTVAAMRPDPARIALATVTGAAASAMTIALMGTSGWLISRAAQQPPVMYLMIAVVAVRTFGIGRGVLRYAERLAGHDVALRGVVTLRETLYRRLAAAEPEVASGLRRGDLLARLGADVDAAGDLIVRSLLPFAVAALTSVVSLAALALMLPSVAGILLIGLLFAAVGAPLLAAWAGRRAIRDTTAARSAMSSQVLALLDGLPELTVAGVVRPRLDALDRADGALSRGLDRASRPAALAAALSSGAMLFATVGCLAVGVQAVADGRLAPVMLAVVTLVPLAVAEAVAGLPAAAAGLVRAAAAGERIVALLDVPVTGDLTEDDDQLAWVPGSVARLQAQGLSCGRMGRSLVLDGVDLDLTAGQRVAIVGASGAGKSTLLLTLAGLLPAAGGRVLLDGADIGVLTAADRCRAVNFTADDAHVFTTTVRENLRVVRADADDDAIRRALAEAGLSGWLDALPAGLDTPIGDPAGPAGLASGGWPLSGGERRRLLVARALLSRAGVLLVDEPAEHLDTATADALVRELFATGRTVVVVTHRLTPLAAADEVLVLAGGRVAARGRHQDLLADHPPYRDAWLSEQEALVPPRDRFTSTATSAG